MKNTIAKAKEILNANYDAQFKAYNYHIFECIKALVNLFTTCEILINCPIVREAISNPTMENWDKVQEYIDANQLDNVYVYMDDEYGLDPENGSIYISEYEVSMAFYPYDKLDFENDKGIAQLISRLESEMGLLASRLVRAEQKDLTQLNAKIQNCDRVITAYHNSKAKVNELQKQIKDLIAIDNSQLGEHIKQFCDTPTVEKANELKQYCTDTLCRFDIDIDFEPKYGNNQIWLTIEYPNVDISNSVLHTLWLPERGYDLQEAINARQKDLNALTDRMEKFLSEFFTDKISETEFSLCDWY